jgi:hypothetical protein
VVNEFGSTTSKPRPSHVGRLRRIAVRLAAVLGLTACVNTEFNVAQVPLDEHTYASIYPYFAEYCALSEIRKKQGSGVEIVGGGPGGHSLFYLNGVCRRLDANYPVLTLCDGSDGDMTARGVGLSVNAHFRNANWIAVEGRDFLYDGDLAPGEGVTQASYARTIARAEQMGFLNGIEFHAEVFDDKPAGMSRHDYMYEVSAATDYATGFGRDRYCARVPLDRSRMDRIVQHLNALNRPYREGKPFEWDVLRNNCAYLAHNALAVAGLWPEWPVDRPLLIAAFDFPVPKNEFVNVMRRTNDFPIADPDAVYEDDAARSEVLREGFIPTQPGALAQARPAVSPNDLYDTDLRLIFFDEAIFGHYQQRFDRIFAGRRYTDLTANLQYFSGLYAEMLASQPTLAASMERAAFYRRYYDAVAREKDKVDAMLAHLPGTAGEGYR